MLIATFGIPIVRVHVMTIYTVYVALKVPYEC